MGRKERRTRSTLRPATGIESVPTADRPTANRRSCTEWLGFRALCRCPIGPRGWRPAVPARRQGAIAACGGALQARREDGLHVASLRFCGATPTAHGVCGLIMITSEGGQLSALQRALDRLPHGSERQVQLRHLASW